MVTVKQTIKRRYFQMFFTAIDYIANTKKTVCIRIGSNSFHTTEGNQHGGVREKKVRNVPVRVSPIGLQRRGNFFSFFCLADFSFETSSPGCLLLVLIKFRA